MLSFAKILELLTKIGTITKVKTLFFSVGYILYFTLCHQYLIIVYVFIDVTV